MTRLSCAYLRQSRSIVDPEESGCAQLRLNPLNANILDQIRKDQRGAKEK
ncbi:hypothetical protein [Pelagibius sp. Alg239-R121]|nr:hypothetical protein [Pelagibius sp. Alg239-R121]